MENRLRYNKYSRITPRVFVFILSSVYCHQYIVNAFHSNAVDSQRALANAASDAIRSAAGGLKSRYTVGPSGCVLCKYTLLTYIKGHLLPPTRKAWTLICILIWQEIISIYYNQKRFYPNPAVFSRLIFSYESDRCENPLSKVLSDFILYNQDHCCRKW